MTLELDVRNVGGIDELTISFSDGVTLVTGPNASNKTSLLNAFAFALGRDDVPLRSGATTAEVTLSTDERSVTRTAERAGTGLSVSGEPWLADADADADALASFAALLEFNELRAAVRNGGSFADALKAPMDVEALEAERSAKVAEKQSLQQDLDELADAPDALAAVEADITEKRTEIEELEADLEALREERSASVESDDELAELRAEHADLVSERDEQRRRVESTESAIERLEDRRDELVERVADAEADVDEYDVDALEAEKERLERRVAEREERVDILQSVLTANREMLNGGFAGALGQTSSIDGDEFVCWTCGRPAEADAFEETLSDLESLVEADRSTVEEHRPAVEEVAAKLDAATDAEARVRELSGELRDVEGTLAERQESLSTQRERLRELDSRIEEVSEEIAEREREYVDEADDLTTELEETRASVQSARDELARLHERRDELESRVAELEETEARVADLGEEIAALTDRIENTERELRESFNGAMSDLVDALGFERIQRVWLDGEFDLVVAREVEGTVQHESVSHLAESERELIGLVLGLAGCVTYDVPSRVPALALDSVGAFDTERARRLIEYFAEATDYVLVATHPERAADLGFPIQELDTWASVDL